MEAPASGVSRTDAIVERVRRELERHRHTSLCSDLTSAQIVNEALARVRAQADSLDHQAILVVVTRQILLITAHALGRMGVESGIIYGLDSFCVEIEALVHQLTATR